MPFLFESGDKDRTFKGDFGKRWLFPLQQEDYSVILGEYLEKETLSVPF